MALILARNGDQLLNIPALPHASRVLSATGLWLSSPVLGYAEGCTWLSWLCWGSGWAAGALPSVQESNLSLKGNPKANIPPVLPQRGIFPKYTLLASIWSPSSCNLGGLKKVEAASYQPYHPTLPWALLPSSLSRRCAHKKGFFFQQSKAPGLPLDDPDLIWMDRILAPGPPLAGRFWQIALHFRTFFHLTFSQFCSCFVLTPSSCMISKRNFSSLFEHHSTGKE